MKKTRVMQSHADCKWVDERVWINEWARWISVHIFVIDVLDVIDIIRRRVNQHRRLLLVSICIVYFLFFVVCRFFFRDQGWKDWKKLCRPGFDSPYLLEILFHLCFPKQRKEGPGGQFGLPHNGQHEPEHRQ